VILIEEICPRSR